MHKAVHQSVGSHHKREQSFPGNRLSKWWYMRPTGQSCSHEDEREVPSVQTAPKRAAWESSTQGSVYAGTPRKHCGLSFRALPQSEDCSKASQIHLLVSQCIKKEVYVILQSIQCAMALYLKKKKSTFLNLKILVQNANHCLSFQQVIITDHCYDDNEKVWSVPRISKLWHRHEESKWC